MGRLRQHPTKHLVAVLVVSTAGGFVILGGHSSTDLVDLRERVRWSREQAVDLSKRIDAYFATKPFQLSSETDPAGLVTVYAQLTTPPPSHLAIQCGSIAHELRATLDALACVLAVRNGAETDGTYFPISANRTVFTKDGHKKMRKLSAADQAAIAALEPYGGGHPLLHPLHATDLVRKHQRLIVANLGLDNTQVRPMGLVRHMEINSGVQIGAAKRVIARYSRESEIEFAFNFAVSFGEPEALRGRPLLPVLEEFASLVDSIVHLFD